jgi:hypothetical protein
MQTPTTFSLSLRQRAGVRLPSGRSKYAVVGLASLWFEICPAHAVHGDTVVAYAPVQTCGQFNGVPQQNYTLYSLISSWAVGYVSGLAKKDQKVSLRIARIDAAGFIKLLESYCRSNPSSDFSEAIEWVGRH